jgi:hypothetical protein
MDSAPAAGPPACGRGMRATMGEAVQKPCAPVDKEWMAGGTGCQHRAPRSQPPRRIGWVKKNGSGAYTTESVNKKLRIAYVRVRGGRVSKCCVVRVRVSGLVHKAMPTQAWPLCKTRSPRSFCHMLDGLSECDRLPPTWEDRSRAEGQSERAQGRAVGFRPGGSNLDVPPRHVHSARPTAVRSKQRGRQWQGMPWACWG